MKTKGSKYILQHKIFQDAVINDDLKKYKDHPIVRKKKEKAIEALKKAGLM